MTKKPHKPHKWAVPAWNGTFLIGKPKLQQVVLTVYCGFVFRLLVNLIKRKPQMTDEQIKTIADGFTAMVDKCCKQSDIETCFGEEVFPISF